MSKFNGIFDRAYIRRRYGAFLLIILVVYILFTIMLFANSDSLVLINLIVSMVDALLEEWHQIITSLLTFAGILVSLINVVIPFFEKYNKKTTESQNDFAEEERKTSGKHKRGCKTNTLLSKIALAIMVIYTVKTVNAAYVPVVELVATNNESQHKSENVQSVDSLNDIIIFDIDYRDPLFKNYDVIELESNKQLLAEQILEDLKSVEKFSYDDDNYKIYIEKVDLADEYERLYLLIDKENIFDDQFRGERIQFILKCIEMREAGDDKHKDSENERLISVRYKELADEKCKLEEYDKVGEYYNEAIYWALESLHVSYNQNNNDATNRIKSINNIISAYKEIMAINTSDNDDYKRANILKDVFEKIRDSLD